MVSLVSMAPLRPSRLRLRRLSARRCAPVRSMRRRSRGRLPCRVRTEKIPNRCMEKCMLRRGLCWSLLSEADRKS